MHLSMESPQKVKPLLVGYGKKLYVIGTEIYKQCKKFECNNYWKGYNPYEIALVKQKERWRKSNLRKPS